MKDLYDIGYNEGYQDGLATARHDNPVPPPDTIAKARTRFWIPTVIGCVLWVVCCWVIVFSLAVRQW